jgi:hypothetical protein
VLEADLDVPGRDAGHHPADVQLDGGPPGTLDRDQLGPGAGGQHLGEDPVEAVAAQPVGQRR